MFYILTYLIFLIYTYQFYIIANYPKKNLQKLAEIAGKQEKQERKEGNQLIL